MGSVQVNEPSGLIAHVIIQSESNVTAFGILHIFFHIRGRIKEKGSRYSFDVADRSFSAIEFSR